MPAHHVYLVPGFFGFANLGRITYFGHVRRALGDALRARGLDARIHVVRVHPTASLARRAATVVDTIAVASRRSGATWPASSRGKADAVRARRATAPWPRRARAGT